MSRVDILRAAIEHTDGERDAQYGPPVGNMEDIAVMWNAYLKVKGLLDGDGVTGGDVAHMMHLMKLCRTLSPTYPSDTYEDGAAYWAIAGECAGL